MNEKLKVVPYRRHTIEEVKHLFNSLVRRYHKPVPHPNNRYVRLIKELHFYPDRVEMAYYETRTYHKRRQSP